MSYKKLLVHRCDIYRLEDQQIEENYGVKVNRKNVYGKEPIATDVRCYFTKHIKNTFLMNGQPNAVITDIMNVHFLKGADVQTNDIVVYEGDRYKLKLPKLIRNHHIETEAERIDSL